MSRKRRLESNISATASKTYFECWLNLSKYSWEECLVFPVYNWDWSMTKHVRFSNLSISVKPDKTIPRVWKLPLQKEDGWVGVKCLWCRPDTAQECAISCFLQHQKNQRARDCIHAYSSNPSSQKFLHRGDLSQGTAPRLCLAICASGVFFFMSSPGECGGGGGVAAVAVFSLWLHIPPVYWIALCQSTPYIVLKGVGHTFIWRPVPHHKTI